MPCGTIHMYWVYWDTVAAFRSKDGLHLALVPMHMQSPPQQRGLRYPWDSIWWSLFCSTSQVSTCSCIFTFGCLDVFFPFLFKTCSKPRLKLTLLRDRCRDEVPIIWSTELFIANNRSNKIGSCRTGIHVIAVSKVITDLALVQAFCLPKHWMEVKEANDYPYSGQSWSINPISIPLTQQQKTVVDF